MNRPPNMTVVLAIACALCVLSASAVAQSQEPGDRKAAAATTTVQGKGHHVVQELHSTAKDIGNPSATAAVQTMLDQTFGITLVMDDGTRVFGMPRTNKTGRILATKAYPHGSDPGQVEMVNVANDDGWWREPDTNNAVVLIETLNTDSNPVWRAVAALALQGANTPEVIKTLVTALEKDSAANVRRCAAIALYQIGTPKAVEALKIAVEKDPSPWVRGEIKKAIDQAHAAK